MKDPKDRACRFREGLDKEIRIHVIANVVRTYADIVSITQKVEVDLDLKRKRDRGEGKDPNHGSSKRHHGQ